MIEVIFEPGGKPKTLERPVTVLGLLNKLQLRQTEALIIRDGELLTPDRTLKHGDVIRVRPVTSRG